MTRQKSASEIAVRAEYEHLKATTTLGNAAAWAAAKVNVEAAANPEPPPLDADDAVMLASLPPGSDSVEAVEWVASSLASPSTRPGDAPSRSAWGLLVWAREHSDIFWSAIWAKRMTMDRQAAESRQQRDESPDEIIAALDAVRDSLDDARSSCAVTDELAPLLLSDLNFTIKHVDGIYTVQIVTKDATIDREGGELLRPLAEAVAQAGLVDHPDAVAAKRRRRTGFP